MKIVIEIDPYELKAFTKLKGYSHMKDWTIEEFVQAIMLLGYCKLKEEIENEEN